MFTLFRSAADRLYIDRGHVSCPLRKRDVEMIDACTGCRWLCEIEERAALPYVRCRPPVASDPGPTAF